AETYFNWELLFNKSGNGYMQRTEKIEQELFQTLYKQIDRRRSEKTPSVDWIFKLYDDCDAFISSRLGEL
ncbi:MAG: hypothetical protein LBH04_12055, partial [Tannerellaceae bacterium]|nr:hypothetical protein [Tannerellaceae bacterium]